MNKKDLKNRLLGIDVARAIAVFGMIFVNFKVVFGAEGSPWLKSVASIIDGKSAATFVVLAGVGLALMTNSAIDNKDDVKLKLIRFRIFKRAIFLFVMGSSYLYIWPADILHFYGIYMLIIILLLRSSQRSILYTISLLIVAFPVLMIIFDYESGWNFETLDYQGFWTIEGLTRNLFFNGFHPVIPWAAFMLFGFWYGKQDLSNHQFIKKSLWISSISFIIIQSISYFLISILSDGSLESRQALSEIVGTNPMPPLPLYMLSGMAVAIVIISTSILLAWRFKDHLIIVGLHETGKLALTFYVAHVIIGMGAVEIVSPFKMGGASIEFSLAYALIFSLLCILFALFWKKYYASGPLEWAIRKLTD